MSEPVENCGNCAFGVIEYMHQSSRITCHRHAPKSFEVCVGILGGASTSSEKLYEPRSFWPEVKRDDFCGDFELKDAG